MAKPLGEKSKMIRQAIEAHPDLGNAEIAALLGGSEDRKKDRLEFKAQDVAQQKVALKKLAGDAPAKKSKGGRPRKAAPAPAREAAPAAAMEAAPTGLLSLLDDVLLLAKKCGGIETLKGLVGRIAEMQGK